MAGLGCWLFSWIWSYLWVFWPKFKHFSRLHKSVAYLSISIFTSFGDGDFFTCTVSCCCAAAAQECESERKWLAVTESKRERRRVTAFHSWRSNAVNKTLKSTCAPEGVIFLFLPRQLLLDNTSSSVTATSLRL